MYIYVCVCNIHEAVIVYYWFGFLVSVCCAIEG